MDDLASASPKWWLDIAKLTVSFVFALALLWIRTWYREWRERLAKQLVLWQLFHQDISSLKDELDELDALWLAHDQGNVRIVAFSVPEVSGEIAKRLAEVDPSTLKRVSL